MCLQLVNSEKPILPSMLYSTLSLKVTYLTGDSRSAHWSVVGERVLVVLSAVPAEYAAPDLVVFARLRCEVCAVLGGGDGARFVESEFGFCSFISGNPAAISQLFSCAVLIRMDDGCFCECGM